MSKQHTPWNSTNDTQPDNSEIESENEIEKKIKEPESEFVIKSRRMRETDQYVWIDKTQLIRR